MGTNRGASAVRTGIGADGPERFADDAIYERLHPYYAEVCALSELRKKRGIGVPLRSGMGGHSLLYLNGVRVDRREAYPTLVLCEPGGEPGRHCVGISVNSHYRNANWVAAEGRDFIWRGALGPGESLTHASYERTQRLAKAQGVLDGIEFQGHLFRDKPPGMSERDYMYEISIASDYAVRFGRNVYRARVPLDRNRMAVIVDFLNGLNAPYRGGELVFRWDALNNNCSHVGHNALAAAGIWAPWPTGQFFAIAAFRFPVPKNEFVDIVLRTNDLRIDDARAMFDDELARRALLETGALPTAPAALAIAEQAIRENEVYETDRLRLIFYANPFWGHYRRHFDRILGEPRYSDLGTNLRHFAQIYERATERRSSARGRQARSDAEAQFCMHYDRYIEREAARVNDLLSRLDRTPEIAEAVS
ncbi:MAG TPA: hypothetical protein VMF62_17805 [Acetobacteraceae bacterium]|nr:hypothetical protein [Acetobacteraceae bacterium]